MQKIIFIFLLLIGLSTQNTAFSAQEHTFFDENHNLLVKYQDIDNNKKIFKSEGKDVTYLKLNNGYRLFYADKYFEILNLKNKNITLKHLGAWGVKFKSAELDTNNNIIVYLNPPQNTDNFIIKDEIPRIIIQPDGKVIDKDKFTHIYNLIKINDKYYSVESYTPAFYTLLETISGNESMRLPRSLFLYEIKDEKAVYKEFVAPYFGYAAYGFRGDIKYNLDGKKLDIQIKHRTYNKFDIKTEYKTFKLNKKFKPRTLWGKIDEIRGKIPRFYELIVASSEPLAKVTPEGYTYENYSTSNRPEINNLRIRDIYLSEKFTSDEKNNKYYNSATRTNQNMVYQTSTKRTHDNNFEWIKVSNLDGILYVLYFKNFENPKLYQYKDNKLYFMKEFNSDNAAFKYARYAIIISLDKSGYKANYIYTPKENTVQYSYEGQAEKANFKLTENPNIINLIKRIDPEKAKPFSAPLY